jgi:Tn3 transposase DDE domain
MRCDRDGSNLELVAWGLRNPYGLAFLPDARLLAVDLGINVLVLWNTLYMDAALAHLRRAGAAVKPEDVARLSPLSHEHINVLGRYSFALADSIAEGELRPLHQPDDHGDLAAGAA